MSRPSGSANGGPSIEARVRATATLAEASGVCSNQPGHDEGDAANLRSRQLLHTLQEHVDDLRGLLQCGICVRPLYEPFTIACGHTFCYTCLTSWFANARPNRTCPDCRAPVKSKPAPAYLVRSLVHIFTCRAELLEKGETTAQHVQNQKEEADKIEQDKANPNPRTGGLFRGIFNTKTQFARPVIDVEDNVVRCPGCTWELERGERGCAHCGYRFADEDGSVTGTSDSEGLTDIDGNSEMTDWTDDIDDGFGDDDFDWNEVYDRIQLDPDHMGFHSLRNLFPQPMLGPAPRPWSGFGRRLQAHDDDPEEEVDSEDNSEMDSFIDDEELGEDEYPDSDQSTVVGGRRRRRLEYDDGSSQLGTDASMSQDDDSIDDSLDEDTEDEEEPIRSVTGNPGRRARLVNRPRPWANNVARVAATVFDEDHQPGRHRPPPAAPGPGVGSSARNAIAVDDDSDEEPIAPGRRAQVRRGCGSRAI